MGACCSKDPHFRRPNLDDKIEEENSAIVDYGPRMRLHGHSKYISMYTQQGRKGVNQDAMTIWERTNKYFPCKCSFALSFTWLIQDFTGNKDMVFCGVFDGHGPYGHKVARYLSNTLPLRISLVIKSTQLELSGFTGGSTHVAKQNNKDESSAEEEDCHSSPIEDNEKIALVSSWESSFLKSFKDMDEELRIDAGIDTYCSGATVVTAVKKGNHLMIANLGDSRAVLCTRGNNNQLFVVQLTNDLKSNVSSETERIKKCNGRVFALDEEPEVFRVWLPDEDCPGLAMARSFGDFCLKDYGLISTPKTSYRRLTKNNEFIVLATDGVWDILTNIDVIKIVASVRNWSMVAKMLMKFAVRAWRIKYPISKLDDCAVVCLFLKNQTTLLRSSSKVRSVSFNNAKLARDYSEVSRAPTIPRKSIVIRQGEETEKNCSCKERKQNEDPYIV